MLENSMVCLRADTRVICPLFLKSEKLCSLLSSRETTKKKKKTKHSNNSYLILGKKKKKKKEKEKEKKKVFLDADQDLKLIAFRLWWEPSLVNISYKAVHNIVNNLTNKQTR